MANSRIRVPTAGKQAFAADFAPNPVIGNVLSVVAGAPGEPLDVAWGAGGGSSTTNLSNVVFADRATSVPLANQTGNIETPFASLQSAVTAAAALPQPATVAVVGSTVAYGNIVLPAGSLLTIAQFEVLAAGIAAAGTAGADGLILGNVTTGGAGALLRVVGAQIGNLICHDNTEQVVLERCSVLSQTAGLVSNPSFQLYSSTWLGNMHHSGLTALNSDISFGVVTADTNGATVSFGNGCVFTHLSLVDPGPAVTVIAGDLASMCSMQLNLSAGGGPLTNYTLTAGWSRRSFRLTVPVPAVLAGQVQYWDILNVQFECMQENDPIAVNPVTDLVAAGAGGGFLNARMVNNAGTIECRMAFVGPLAGGPADFVFTVI